jgi:hypothetical protein
MHRRHFAKRLTTGVLGAGGVQGLNTLDYLSQSELASDVRVVDTIESLQGQSPDSEAVVRVLGYYSPMDGGGGLFVWNPGDTTARDGGTVFHSKVSGFKPGDRKEGRWKRVVDGARVNVLWFGASPEGDLDAVPAIQAAVDALKASSDFEEASLQHPGGGYHGTIYLPRGTYLIGQTVDLNIGGVRFLGDGSHATILKAAPGLSPDDTLINVEGTEYGSSPGPIRNVYVAHLGLVGSDADPSVEPSGITAHQMNYWTIEHVDFHYLNYSLNLRRSFVGHIEDVNSLSCQNGVILNRTTHNVNVISSRFNGTEAKGGNGLRVRGCFGFAVVGCNFESSDWGLQLDDGIRGVSIEGCYFEKNKKGDIKLEKSRSEQIISGVSIAGNLFNSHKEQAIYIQGAEGRKNSIAGLNVCGNHLDPGHKFLIKSDMGTMNLDRNSISTAANSLGGADATNIVE